MTQQGRDLFAQQQIQQPETQPAQGRDLFAQQQAPVSPYLGTPEQQARQQQLASLQGGELASALWTAYTGGDRRTEETARTPELINAPIADIGAAVGFNLATNFDPVEIRSVIEENIPLAEFRTDAKNNTFVDIGGQEYLINRPGMSQQDMGAAIGNVLAFAGPAKLASLGKSMLTRLGMGGLTGGATQAAIEGVQSATGGEFSPGEVASAALFGAAGELPAAIRSARMSDDARKMVGSITDAQAEFARDIRARTGVELMPNQANGTEYQNLVALALRRDAEAGEQFANRLRQQSTDAYAGVTNLLDDLATQDMGENAARNVREASLESIAAAKKYRKQRTDPLYESVWSGAIERRQMVNVDDIIESIAPAYDDSAGEIQKAYEGIIQRLREASEPNSRGTNVRRLHNLKKALFADKAKLSTSGVMNNELSRVYTDVYDQVRNRLVDEVPGYDAANTLFRNLSPEVDALEEGIIGNVANVDPAKLAGVRRLLFNWQETNANPQAIRQAKQVIREANPDAWTALVRNKIEQDLAQIGVGSAEEATDTTVNVLQKLYSSTFSGRDRTMMMAALDGDQRANFNALGEAIERARIRPGQSATAQLQEIERLIGGNQGAGGLIAAITSSPQALINRALNLQSTREQNIRALSKVMLDPQWMDRMSEIRRMGMASPRGGAAFAQLFRSALVEDQQQETQ